MDNDSIQRAVSKAAAQFDQDDQRAALKLLDALRAEAKKTKDAGAIGEVLAVVRELAARSEPRYSDEYRLLVVRFEQDYAYLTRADTPAPPAPPRKTVRTKRRRAVTLFGLGVCALAAYFLIPIFVAVISLGEICPYSPAGINLCGASSVQQADNRDVALQRAKLPPAARTYLSEPITAALCRKPGIRYVGSTDQGDEVCLTLAADRTNWLEFGFRHHCTTSVSGNRADTTGSSYDEGPEPLTSRGRITAPDFEATIRGARASGVLENGKACGGNTVAWTARRAQ